MHVCWSCGALSPYITGRRHKPTHRNPWVLEEYRSHVCEQYPRTGRCATGAGGSCLSSQLGWSAGRMQNKSAKGQYAGRRIVVPSAPSPVSGHAALPPVWDVLAELMQFPDETLWPALRDLGPEDLMRMHDLLGSAFADRMGLTPLRFQNPPPDVDMEDKTRPEVPPAAPDTNMMGPPATDTTADPNSDLLGLGEDGPPAPTSVPDPNPPEITRRSGYAEGGPLPNLGNQDVWNPAWLRQLDPSDLDQDSYDWVDVSPPLPRVMAENGPWSNREGWKIRVCSGPVDAAAAPDAGADAISHSEGKKNAKSTQGA